MRPFSFNVHPDKSKARRLAWASCGIYIDFGLEAANNRRVTVNHDLGLCGNQGLGFELFVQLKDIGLGSGLTILIGAAITFRQQPVQRLYVGPEPRETELLFDVEHLKLFGARGFSRGHARSVRSRGSPHSAGDGQLPPLQPGVQRICAGRRHSSISIPVVEMTSAQCVIEPKAALTNLVKLKTITGWEGGPDPARPAHNLGFTVSNKNNSGWEEGSIPAGASLCVARDQQAGSPRSQAGKAHFGSIT